MNPIITLDNNQLLAVQYEMNRENFQGTIDEFIQGRLNSILANLVNSMITSEINNGNIDISTLISGNKVLTDLQDAVAVTVAALT